MDGQTLLYFRGFLSCTTCLSAQYSTVHHITCHTSQSDCTAVGTNSRRQIEPSRGAPSMRDSRTFMKHKIFHYFFFALTTQMKSFDIRTFFLLNFLIPKPVGIRAATLNRSKEFLGCQLTSTCCSGGLRKPPSTPSPPSCSAASTSPG